jgi:hypothetical protein
MPGRSAQAAGRARALSPSSLRRLRPPERGLLAEAFVEGEVDPTDVTLSMPQGADTSAPRGASNL